MMPTAARLPFSFARRFGVLLDTSTTPAALLIRADTPLTALAEAQRLAGGRAPRAAAHLAAGAGGGGADVPARHPA